MQLFFSNLCKAGDAVSGAYSRRKGANYERELVHRFREVMPNAEIRRGLQSRSGEEMPDVECPVFWIEAKRGRKPNIRTALRQAEGDAPKGRIPIAVVRDDYQPALVALPLEDFLALVREWWIGRER